MKRLLVIAIVFLLAITVLTSTGCNCMGIRGCGYECYKSCGDLAEEAPSQQGVDYAEPQVQLEMTENGCKYTMTISSYEEEIYCVVSELCFMQNGVLLFKEEIDTRPWPGTTVETSKDFAYSNTVTFKHYRADGGNVYCIVNNLIVYLL